MQVTSNPQSYIIFWLLGSLAFVIPAGITLYNAIRHEWLGLWGISVVALSILVLLAVLLWSFYSLYPRQPDERDDHHQ